MIDDLLAARAARDAVRASIVHELKKVPLTKALVALLKADEIATERLKTELDKNHDNSNLSTAFEYLFPRP